MYSLRVNKTVVIKGADKVTAAIVWNLEDYLKKVSKQLEENDKSIWRFQTTRVRLRALSLSNLKK